jgi:hypothetical protein
MLPVSKSPAIRRHKKLDRVHGFERGPFPTYQVVITAIAGS